MKCFFTGMEWFPNCRDGGLDRYFYEQVQALAEAGMKGQIMISYGQPTKVGSLEMWPLAPAAVPLTTRWRAARRLAGGFLKSGVDLVNSHFALYVFPWLRMIPRETPLVVNFQGPWAEEMRLEAGTARKRWFSRLAYLIEKAVYRRADRVVTLSESMRQLLHARYRVPLDRITVMPGGLHLDLYRAAPEREAARRQLGWAPDRPTIIAVRRLARRMGLDLLIEAVAEVRKAFPDVLLLIGGRGAERESLQSAVNRFQLEENVKLVGFIPEADLPTFYAAADFSVVPTVALEGFGLITVESLASGTPVLGTPVGATPEILRPLQSDLVFEAPTARAMAERLTAVLRGDVTLPTAGLCRSYAQRYGWPEVVPKLLSMYQEEIGKARRARQ